MKPKYLVALGGIAAKNLLQTSTGIMRLRGKCTATTASHSSAPSTLVLSGLESAKKDCWEDMKMLLKEMAS